MQLSARMEQMIAMLGETEENKVLKVAGAIIEVMGDDTHKNIDAAFHQLINSDLSPHILFKSRCL